MLHARLLTGGMLIGLLAALVWVSAAWPELRVGDTSVAAPAWWMAAFLVVALGGREAAMLIERRQGFGLNGVVGGLLGAGAVFAASMSSAALAATTAGACLTFAATRAVLAGEGERAWRSAVSALVAFTWLGIGVGCWAAFVSRHGAATAACAIMVVKLSDIGAYFTGRAIGRHKLVPWLSPGKTREGLAGGILVATTGGLLAWWMGLADGSTPVDWPRWVAFGALAGVVGPLGDLFESLLKRTAGAKDSGTTLPGMGGVLDVVDSLTIAGPFVLVVFT